MSSDLPLIITNQGHVGQAFILQQVLEGLIEMLGESLPSEAVIIHAIGCWKLKVMWNLKIKFTTSLPKLKITIVVWRKEDCILTSLALE